jgi:hypothetical protein
MAGGPIRQLDSYSVPSLTDCSEILAQCLSYHLFLFLSLPPVPCLCVCLCTVYGCIWSIRLYQSASFSICCTVNVYGAQESIPPGWESIPGFLKGLQIRALSVWCHFCLSFCILDAVTPSVFLYLYLLLYLRCVSFCVSAASVSSSVSKSLFS